LADAIAYVRRMDAGLDIAIRAATLVFFNAHNDLLGRLPSTGARRLWARIMRERFVLAMRDRFAALSAQTRVRR